MSYNSTQFPVQQFLQCIRNNRTGSQQFILSANQLNTEWIYEIIKHCHNSILQMKQLPTTKLNALYIIRDLIQTCQIPCVNLVEVFIMPIVYQIAIQKPQQKGQRRGSTFFQLNGKSSRIPNIQETGIKFLGLCPQILYAVSMIKPRKTFQNQQLKQKSQSLDYFEKFKKYDIYGTPNSPSQLKYFSKDFISKGRTNYLTNLKSFHFGANDYSQYLVSKIMQSLQSDNNTLFNANHSVSTLSNQLDIRKLLKHGDTLITSPLIDEMISKLKTLESFMAKKNCLSLLTDFVKWGDIQAFIKLCYDGIFQYFGKRIAEVAGNKGLTEGQNIYPQVKGQRQGKRKFYIQYLKSLQVFNKCLQNSKVSLEQTVKIQDLYNYLKRQKKFQFPQNLMLKRIQTDFQTYLANNEQRNNLVLKRINQQGNSINSKISRKSYTSKEVPESILQILNKDLQECFQQICQVPQTQSQLSVKMKKITKLKKKFEEQIVKINDEEISQHQLNQILDNGQQIAKLVQKLQVLHKKYKNKTISFNQYKIKYAQLTKDLQEMESQQQKPSKIQDQMIANELNLKQSQEQVINSFNLKKHKNNKSVISSHFKSDDKQSKISIGKNYTQPNGNAPNQYIAIIQQRNKPTTEVNSFKLSDNNLHQLSSRTGDNFKKQTILKDPYQLTVPNMHNFQPNQSQILNNFIKSNISQNKNGRNKQQNNIKNSQISQKISEGSQINKSNNKQISKISQKNNDKKIKIAQNNNNNNNNFVYIENGQSFSKKSSSILSKNNKQQNSQVHQEFSDNFHQPKSQLKASELRLKQKTGQKVFTQTAQIQYNKIKSVSPKNSLIEKQSFQEGSEKSQNYQSHNKNNNFNGYRTQEQPRVSFGTPPNNLYLTTQQFNKKPANIYRGQPYFSSNGFTSSEKQPSDIKKSSQKSSQKGTSHIKLVEQQKNFMKQSQSGISSNSVAPVVANNKHYSQISQSQQFKTCKDAQFQNKSSSKNSQYESSKSKNIKKYSVHSSAKSESKSNSFYSVNNKQRQFSDVQQLKLNNNYYYAVDQDDQIQEPQCKPLQNSYYGYHDIEKDIKKTANPQFKNCFKIDKHIISSPINNNLQKLDSLHKSRSNNHLRSGHNQFSQLKSSRHQQYLIAKLKRQYESQYDDKTKQLNNRVQELKRQNSKLRNQFLLKNDASQGMSKSNSSSDIVKFSRQKSYPSNSYMPSSRPINSQAALGILQGQQLNQSIYNKFLSCLTNDKLKKSCIRNKSTLYKDEICQIGCMFKYLQKQTVVLLLYFTANYQITDMNFQITKQQSIETQVITKPINYIPNNKQIKIQIISRLQNIPYSLPQIYIQFYLQGQKKNISFYLPLTFNKYVQIVKTDNTKSEQEILKQIADNQDKMIRTSSITINNKMATAILEQYKDQAIKLSNVHTSTVHDCFVYSFLGERFLFILNNVAKNQIVLQGLPLSLNSLEILKYFLSTFKRIISY